MRIRSGRHSDGNPRFALAMTLAALLALTMPLVARAADQDDRFFQQTNLVSDLPGQAQVTDAHLVNPWGLVSSPTSPWWIADNGSGVSTVYDGNGHPFPAAMPIVVTIPPPGGSPAGTTAAPTGTVFNATAGFVVTKGSASGASVFLFATEDGTIAGWSPKADPANAILAVDNSQHPTAGAGAVYKGLALGQRPSGAFLFATNFRAGTIDVFDAQFHPVQQAGTFTDPAIPAGYAPFGIRAIGDQLYVTYAKQDAAKHDDDAGPGRGFVDVFDTGGHLRRHLIAQGALNSPWGLALAPDEFGRFGGALLVGNFGDGHISAYNLRNGKLLGQLETSKGQPIVIDGLWALGFGNGGVAGNRDTLFFTAGLDHEQHGLFGTIAARERER
jgi:uncharacterized protein (TIGR03118 family)